MDKNHNDSEISARGQQVITACAFIHHNFDNVEKLFLPKRASTKKFKPGVYELPGGHINFREDIVDGLKREIVEELGMRISVGAPFYVFTYTNEVKESHSIEVIYFATLEDQIKNIKLNPQDHSEFVWISESEIPKIISQNKTNDDPEIKAIKKGFEILKSSLNNAI